MPFVGIAMRAPNGENFFTERMLSEKKELVDEYFRKTGKHGFMVFQKGNGYIERRAEPGLERGIIKL
jgi:hypothetical protein